MSDVLQATLRGPSRNGLIARAEALAAAYFDTSCVAVVLTNATVSGEADAPEFEASFTAQEHHDVQSRSYGPDVCKGCERKDWPSNRLMRAQAVTHRTDGSAT